MTHTCRRVQLPVRDVEAKTHAGCNTADVRLCKKLTEGWRCHSADLLRSSRPLLGSAAAGVLKQITAASEAAVFEPPQVGVIFALLCDQQRWRVNKHRKLLVSAADDGGGAEGSGMFLRFWDGASQEGIPGGPGSSGFGLKL